MDPLQRTKPILRLLNEAGTCFYTQSSTVVINKDVDFVGDFNVVFHTPKLQSWTSSKPLDVYIEP